jgi:methionyl-tRNA synthetase
MNRMPSKKFYITTSIAYANASPHIGFALELIQADVLARYHRLLGDEVFFLTGTDEHGMKIAKKAREEGKDPKKFVDKISSKFKELTKVLNISNNDFIRTTDEKRHWPAVEKVWQKLKEKGDIYKKRYKGLYCLGCEAFLQKKDLKSGRCFIHQKKPEIVEEENYFFRLSKYAAKVEKILKKDKIKIIPETRKNEILSFIGQGVEDISCSRLRKKLGWGIPVPGDSGQTIYVWFEALINYISALGYPEDKKFKKYWPADVHCVGKDIVKFHSLIWPAMLLSLGAELPKNIFVHGFINVNSQKMSKSLGNVVDPFELVEKYGSADSPQVGTDAVRYFLLREIPSTEDGDFTGEKFKEKYNSDLANGLGNLVARARVMAENHLKTQNPKSKTTTQNAEVLGKIQEVKEKYKKALTGFKFNEALKTIWQLVSFSDKYIEKEKPWESKNQKSKIKNQKVINNLLLMLDEIAELLEPFLPEASERIKREIKRNRKTGKFVNKRGKILFPRLC